MSDHDPLAQPMATPLKRESEALMPASNMTHVSLKDDRLAHCHAFARAERNLEKGNERCIMCPLMKWAWLSLLLTACGGVAISANGDADGGRHRDGGRDAVTDRTVDRGMPPDAKDGSVLPPPYPEDACPNLPPPDPIIHCDPLRSRDTCPPGQACYPFPPEGNDRCHPGPYTTDCAEEGSGEQGTPCGGTQSCSGGFVCVVSGSGDQCVLLCDVGDFNSCKDGLVCQPLDVVGYGGCL
jgi:hypothetical protein